jgi:predicted  nucleic acid-binding Zn-ribbon protein
LAMLDGGVCQCCYIQVPPNKTIQLARGNAIIQCSSCDRIMYLP